MPESIEERPRAGWRAPLATLSLQHLCFHKSDAASRKCSSLGRSERRNEGESAASAPKSHEGTRCDYLPAGDTDKAVWVIPLRKSTSGIQSLASPRGVRGFHTRFIYAGRWRR